MKKNKRLVVVGAGFSGLSSACFLAQKGHEVTLLEQHDQVGGRARTFSADGFLFDMGPSWYWMPDVFEHFFASFGKKPSDYYHLLRLDPSYRVVFSEGDVLDLAADFETLKLQFEEIEPGAGNALQRFMDDAAYKYEVGINNLVFKPGLSIREFADFGLLHDIMRMNIFKSFSRHARSYFKHPKLLQLLEFPVLFLGATAEKTPALYSLMNYADMRLGTWYPLGGMRRIATAMADLATELGVSIQTETTVNGFSFDAMGLIDAVETNKGNVPCEGVIASADYAHVDLKLLGKKANYSEDYWNRRTMAPSALLFYLGVDRKLDGLLHHNLFFDRDFVKHAHEIYSAPQWPSDPLFYACVPSITDPSVAPEGKENLFLLMPIAPGLDEEPGTREKYYHLMMDRLEAACGHDVRSHVIFSQSYARPQFEADYNAFKGNAYGLANTLMQTAILKPSAKSKHVPNLFFAGQLTVPGPGVPPALISGEIAAGLLHESFS